MISLVQRLAERFAGILRDAPKAAEWAESSEGRQRLGAPFDASMIAERIAANVRAAVNATIPARDRAAVLDRPIVGERWPVIVGIWTSADTDNEGLYRWACLLDELETALEDGPFWPPTVTALEVAEALEKIATPETASMAEALRSGYFQPGSGAPGQRWHDQDGAESAVDFMVEWDPHAVAVLIAAAKQVRSDAGASRFTPIPASRAARAAMASISRGAAGAWSPLRSLENGRPGVELAWSGGRPAQYQLSLAFGDDLAPMLVRGILDELKVDGLRDYLLLHRMAAEQGRTGQLRWTWREHRERSAYDRRIRNSNSTEPEAQQAVTARLWRLKGAELHLIVHKPDGRVVSERIGPFGLIDIPAHITTDGALDLAPIALNPALYEEARQGNRKPRFTLLEDEAFALDGDRFRLAVMLSLQMRTHRDEGGSLRLSASTLWEYMNIRDGKPVRSLARHRWPALDRALQGALEALARARVIGGWSRADTAPCPEALYSIEPTAAWRDQVVHGVRPELPPLRVIPRTGAEFKAWRLALRLSQADAAALLNVGIATVKRAEKRAEKTPDAALGPALLEAFDREGTAGIVRGVTPDRLVSPDR